MIRITLVVGCLMLSACSPSFEDTLVGTWECTPAGQKPDAALKMTQTLNYKATGQLGGTITVEEKTADKTAILRGKVSGSWKYNGKSVIHTITEEFEELKVGDKIVPKEEVNPMVLAGFRPENSYDVTVDLNDDALIWFEDANKTKPLANCKRQS